MALDGGIRGFGTATEENAESADVEPSLSDATDAAEFHNLVSGIKKWILVGTTSNAQKDDRDD